MATDKPSRALKAKSGSVEEVSGLEPQVETSFDPLRESSHTSQGCWFFSYSLNPPLLMLGSQGKLGREA